MTGRPAASLLASQAPHGDRRRPLTPALCQAKSGGPLDVNKAERGIIDLGGVSTAALWARRAVLSWSAPGAVTEWPRPAGLLPQPSCKRTARRGSGARPVGRAVGPGRGLKGRGAPKTGIMEAIFSLARGGSGASQVWSGHRMAITTRPRRLCRVCGHPAVATFRWPNLVATITLYIRKRTLGRLHDDLESSESWRTHVVNCVV
jgi:hypothetical protein